eukprot:TRINITY_DN29937_c0_g1_i7.p2 TRINITY_DN29937_c0_g1~~TRINITY_DN29937_c0_g1_i7.p2  ORF type:complete len:130 (-),score=0.02 TRINITY_DN29937_c0_g1_i7:233-622(-)
MILFCSNITTQEITISPRVQRDQEKCVVTRNSSNLPRYVVSTRFGIILFTGFLRIAMKKFVETPERIFCFFNRSTLAKYIENYLLFASLLFAILKRDYVLISCFRLSVNLLSFLLLYSNFQVLVQFYQC